MSRGWSKKGLVIRLVGSCSHKSTKMEYKGCMTVSGSTPQEIMEKLKQVTVTPPPPKEEGESTTTEDQPEIGVITGGGPMAFTYPPGPGYQGYGEVGLGWYPSPPIPLEEEGGSKYDMHTLLCSPEQMEILKYKAKLAEIVLKDNLLSDPTNPKWSELNDLITPAVLADAYNNCLEIDYPGQWFVRRTEKTIERINEKKAMVGREDLGFKTNCDLMGFRVIVRSARFALVSTVRELKRTAEQAGNTVHIRGEQAGSKATDIVQYMYIYHTKEGYLAEYQVGHPFAFLKFKHDSAKREGKTWALDFSKCPIKVYNLCKNQLLDPRPDFDLEKVWQAGFGKSVPQNWKNAFAGMTFE